MNKEYRNVAREMIMAGVKAADPSNAIRNSVKVENHILYVKGDAFALTDIDRVLMFGIGKAATPMCRAFEDILRPSDGLCITKIGDEIDLVEVESIPVVRAYHPEPREDNAKYANQILELVDGIGEDENVLVVFLVSGGGSALFTCPPEGVSIDDMYKLNQLLMKCGASIYEINTIRKHVTQVKGGKFGLRVANKGAKLISLILSDVVGDDLSVVASGPTYKDSTTFAQAIELLKKYQIWDETPHAVQKHLQTGLDNPSWEPPRQVPDGVHNYLISNNMVALSAARDVAKHHGFNTILLTTQNTGEAKIIAKCAMGIAKEVQDSANPIAPPAALIMGGEMIVTFDWEDRDGFGPNREFVLSSALEIAGRPNIVVAAADTDGVDGEGKSGAIADGETIARATLDPYYHLNRHEAEAFFDSLGDSLHFQSKTNVNDINVILVGPKK